ncbi:hypothetical protein [Treponema phagedenis]|uniref:Uncharacterized protein n=1 Tax=Treponema phagedenis TaxID=162 RepID=A0A0B7GXQ7_TREPH|nr:hypothetical protein [Treponema phagedenis]CEM61406.1 conserved hypothetical protein [Treponema phagedenis]
MLRLTYMKVNCKMDYKTETFKLEGQAVLLKTYYGTEIRIATAGGDGFSKVRSRNLFAC